MSAGTPSVAASPAELRGWHHWFNTQYDRLYTPHRRHLIEQYVVYVALVAFLMHIAAVAVAQLLPVGNVVRQIVGTSYLGTIYTPFGFILMFEIFLLILALPDSMTQAVMRQFEIISLIVIRNVFKDFAAFETLNIATIQLSELLPVMVDLIGGLMLFFLVGVFWRATPRRPLREHDTGSDEPGLSVYIARKKGLALFLTVVYVVLLGTTMYEWLQVVNVSLQSGNPVTTSPTTLFSAAFFNVLIFVDIVILLLSLLLTSSYHLVFRNAGFVVVTVLLRLGLTAPQPLDVGLSVVGVLFGVLVLLIYKYFTRIQAEP